MAHWAKVLGGQVVEVIKANEEFFDVWTDPEPGRWIQTSYNTRRNVHYGPDGEPDGGVALRGNYAGIGFIYDYENDVFYPPQPWPSWTLDKTIWDWVPPTPYPADGNIWYWDEETLSWIETTIPTSNENNLGTT